MWSRLIPLLARRNAARSPAVSPHRFASLGVAMLSEIPVLIPTFNNPTYLRLMLKQLATRGMRNVIVVDNASDAPDMLALLTEAEADAKVVRLSENRGPRDIIGNDASFRLLPEIFCVTDPDIVFNPELPEDFLVELLAISERFAVGKAGFSLDISDRAALRDDDFVIDDVAYKIWEWEAKYWGEQVGTTEGGDPMYHAEIDTTFALYNKRFLDRDRQYKAIRVAGRYTGRHLPWYKDCGMPASEEKLYRATQKFSYYLSESDAAE
jgi:glycosyltransferase involved in cell wall biosynthesis